MYLRLIGRPVGYRSAINKTLLIMKLTVFILLATCMQLSAEGISQNVSLSLKNASLQKVFREINRQTGYEFFYKDELLNSAGKMNIEVKNVPLGEALKICFANSSLTYSIVDKTIVVKEKAVESSSGTEEGAEEFALITGRITDSVGKPMSGATISVKGTSTAVVSDSEGNFSIEAKAGQILVISFVGYRTIEYKVGNEISITITLVEQRQELINFVLVNTGYQQLPRERSAGSFASVNNDAIKNKSISMNVIDRLEGLVPGLAVNYGRGNDKFTIRGLTTINADKSPLIVVDGVPIYDASALTSLVNPDDVENVNVLRDATAASIWGAAAANGVVVVTTKKGPQGAAPKKMQISYSGFVSLRGQPDLDNYNMMNSSQFVNAGREIFDIAAYPWNTVITASSANNLPMVTPNEQIMYDLARGLITSDVANGRFDSLNRLSNNSQITDLFFQNALLSNHSLNFRGGSNVYSYFGSFGYTRDESYTKTNLDRFQLNLRQDFVISKAIKFDLTTNIAFENSEKFLLTDFPGTANTVLPYAMTTDDAGNPLSMGYLKRYNPFRAASETQSKINLDYIPLQEPGYTKNNANSFNARINAGLSIKLFKGLTYEGRGQYQRRTIDSYEYYDQDSYRVRNERVFFTQAPVAPSTNPTYFLPVSGGHYITNNNEQYAWTIRNQLVYENTFNDKHQLTSLAGVEVRNDFTSGLGTFKRGFDYQTMTFGYIDEVMLGTTGVSNPVNFLPSRTINVLTVNQHNYSEVEKRFLSLYANAAYTYNRKYILNGSIRMDQSNLFGSDKSAQYKPVWSLGGAWNISNEDFFKSNLVSNLRLRLTYGISGNAPVPGQGGPYDIVRAGNNAIFTGLGTGYTIFTPKNDKLTWERTNTTNIGIDFGLWENRLSGSVDVYEKYTSDLLGFIPLDPTTGFSFAYDNLGSLTNKGIEVQLNSINIKKKDFRWSTVFTLSYNENEILSLKRQTALTAGNKISGTQVEGYSAFPIFGYNYIGLDNNGNPLALSATKDTLRLANQIKIDDPQYAGTTQPLWYGGLTNNLSYKNISLSFLIVYNFGHQMRSDVNRFYTGRLTNNIPRYFENRWKAPGDELVTNVPKYIAIQSQSTSQRNTVFYTSAYQNIVSASYAKLRDLTLSYNFNKGLLDKLSMGELSIYGQVNNIMLWRNNDQEIDPEYYDLQNGVRTDLMPAFFTFGVRASFK